jgi:predicted nucleic acid-binding protein
VTESDLLFDTWAWWEYLHETTTGAALRERYVAKGRYRLHTSAISIGELSARLQIDGSPEKVPIACGAIRRMSHLWDVSADIAQEAGRARARLRESSEHASLADAIILITAQRAGARIVSADGAFRDVPGVISH